MASVPCPSTLRRTKQRTFASLQASARSRALNPAASLLSACSSLPQSDSQSKPQQAVNSSTPPRGLASHPFGVFGAAIPTHEILERLASKSSSRNNHLRGACSELAWSLHLSCKAQAQPCCNHRHYYAPNEFASGRASTLLKLRGYRCVDREALPPDLSRSAIAQLILCVRWQAQPIRKFLGASWWLGCNSLPTSPCPPLGKKKANGHRATPLCPFCFLLPCPPLRSVQSLPGGQPLV